MKQEGKKPIGDKCVFKVKRDGSYRAILVVLGYDQIPGVDFYENFSPEENNSSIRIILLTIQSKS